jgi:hypothetical protein
MLPPGPELSPTVIDVSELPPDKLTAAGVVIIILFPGGRPLVDVATVAPSDSVMGPDDCNATLTGVLPTPPDPP